jgi:hypothetical protein
MASLQAQDDVPPYFGINPDQAEQDLGLRHGHRGLPGSGGGLRKRAR